MVKSTEPRPYFILWDYETKGPEGDDVRYRVKRISKNYLDLAESFLDNPPSKKPFLPREIGIAAHALTTYRRDVETWVAMRMMTAILEAEEFDDSELFPHILRELHQLPWHSGSSWKGFYYVQPLAENITTEFKDQSWALKALGMKKMPYLKAENLIGRWYEPNFEDVELWKSRIAINHLRRVTELYAEAALSGRSIGQLNSSQLMHMVDAARKSIQKALPAAPKEEENEK